MYETKIPDKEYNKYVNNYTKGIPNEKKRTKKEVKGEKRDLNLIWAMKS